MRALFLDQRVNTWWWFPSGSSRFLAQPTRRQGIRMRIATALACCSPHRSSRSCSSHRMEACPRSRRVPRGCSRDSSKMRHTGSCSHSSRACTHIASQRRPHRRFSVLCRFHTGSCHRSRRPTPHTRLPRSHRERTRTARGRPLLHTSPAVHSFHRRSSPRTRHLRCRTWLLRNPAACIHTGWLPPRLRSFPAPCRRRKRASSSSHRTALRSSPPSSCS
jgi:hypothetical protein